MGIYALKWRNTIWGYGMANCRSEYDSANHVMLLGDLPFGFMRILPEKSDTADRALKNNHGILLIDSLGFVNASYHSIHGIYQKSLKKEGDSSAGIITILQYKGIVYLPAGTQRI